ncbi:hypothetical protein [Nocardia sp. NPDC057440]|uniref:hypothetical protein n=1 Tax=Nocardia sp. NPDC057440 TaxID=3346134 RepID=UPI00366D1103
MSIEFHWNKVTTITGDMGTLVKAMQTNTEHLRTLHGVLIAELAGAAARDYDATQRDFLDKINLFDGACKDLNDKVFATAADGSSMQEVDIKQGNRFQGIGGR